MSRGQRRAVITGLGVLTPLGLDLDSFWGALRQGRSGIRRIQAFDPSLLPSQIGGEMDGFDARKYIDRKERKRLSIMPRAIQLAVAGAQLALTDAGLGPGKVEPTRFGVIFGAGTIPHDIIDLGPITRMCLDQVSGAIDMARWGREGLATIPPLWMLNHVPNMPACHVSILHDAQGPCNSITQTELGGLLSIGEALRMIQHDRGEVFLVGGGDSRVDLISLIRCSRFLTLSQRNDSPAQACRPFERRRDGQVLGEGAGVLVLEELEHARRRGARIYAEVVGFCSGFDRRKDGTGLARICQRALEEAGVTPAELDHINAHGASSVEGDIWEAQGLHQLQKGLASPVRVFAPRSYFGNTMVAAGGVELAASLLALQRGELPATLNYHEPDPYCPVTLTRSVSPVVRDLVLKVNYSELGQCAAVVCRRLV